MKRDNTQTGARLRECIELQGLRPATVLKKAEEIMRRENINGVSIPSSHMSAYMNGTKSLPEEKAKILAKALNIPEGYLLGDDGFLCDDFDQYMKEIYPFKTEKLGPVFTLFKSAGFLPCAGANGWDGSLDYSITDKEMRVFRFSDKEMYHLYDVIVQTISDYLSDFVTLEDLKITDMDQIDRFEKWHPDFDKSQIAKWRETSILINQKIQNQDKNVEGAPQKKGRKKNERKQE